MNLLNLLVVFLSSSALHKWNLKMAFLKVEIWLKLSEYKVLSNFKK